VTRRTAQEWPICAWLGRSCWHRIGK
jgi:hypothetical protein